MTAESHLKYRPDVDGLRAVAVACVLVFHAFPSALPGGFSGVDIFFVISGYLISGIILGNLRRGSFSFADFYARRIKRIFPALTLVLFVCCLFGWKTLLPDEFAQLGRHLSAGSLFISNLALWSESGYFDTASEVKPLLHLWSLGIEEQYYIFWPLLLFLFRRRLAQLAFPVCVLLLASFVLNLMLVRHRPEAAYYSPASRGWELLIGSMLAYVSLFRPQRLASTAAYGTVISLAGAALIGAGLLLLNQGRGFPGWWALLPTIGAMLIIAAGPDAWLNRTVLSHRAVVYLGLISYPLYLWHWPVLTFARIIAEGTPPHWVRLLALAASLVLAWATYRFVERPIRLPRPGHKPRHAVAALVAAMSIVGITGAFALNNVLRAESAALPVATEVSRAVTDYQEKIEHTIRGQSAETVVFIGDSHVQQYWPRAMKIAAGARPTRRVLFKTKNGCAPIPGIERKGRDCDDFVIDAFAAAHDSNVRTVVIGASWSGFVERTDYYRVGDEDSGPLALLTPRTQWVMDGFEKAVLDLVNSGKEVVIMLSSPRDARLDPKQLLYRDGLSWRVQHVPPVPLQRIDSATAGIDEMLRGIAQRTGATYIDPSDWLCGKEICPNVDEAGRPIYVDGSHVRASIVRDRIDALDRYMYADTANTAANGLRR